MTLKRKILLFLLFTGLALSLFQVWWPHYFLTGDGPCHLYNAKILHDIWSNKDIAFYSRFYHLAFQPNPNWVSHILLASLQYLVSGAVAEKIFLSLYIGLLAGGFYLLLQKINPQSSFWFPVIFLIIFNHPLTKGFYNFSLGTAFYLWMLWSWLRFADKKNTLNALVFFCCTMFTFFTQLLPFVLGIVTCASLILSYCIAGAYNGKQNKLNFFVKNILTLLMLIAPFLALMQWFTAKEGGLRITLHHHYYRLIELVQLKYMVCATHNEYFFAGIAGISFSILMLLCIVFKLRGGLKVHQYDGFLLALLFVVFVYLFFPEDFMGRVILITMRVQLYIVILSVCCITYILPQKFKNAAGILLFLCFSGLSLIRFSYITKASDAAEDYTSVSKYIPPYSVVLPLDFAPEGKDNTGMSIADRNFLFTHAAQYMGADKPLIFLDNYEANAGYFPLTWVYNANPYAHLSSEEGIEAQPPCANIDNYESVSGIKINYIVLWCYDTSFLHKGHYSSLAAQIEKGYHLVYTSPTKRTILYERNGR